MMHEYLDFSLTPTRFNSELCKLVTTKFFENLCSVFLRSVPFFGLYCIGRGGTSESV